MKKIKEFQGIRTYEIKWENRQGQYKYSHELIFPKNTYSPWQDDEDFIFKFETYVEKNTLVDIYRAFELWSISRRLKHVESSIIEIGVWKGGTAILLAESLNNNNSLYLCDTFCGVVKTSEKDNFYKGGEHGDVDFKSVTEFLKILNDSKIKILKGVFPDETGHRIPKTEKFKICHIDVDSYQSAKDIFYWIWPKIIRGGYVIFDDYGFASCEGITLLVNEILSCQQDFHFVYNINGHAILIKK
jgi:O-methyltransferase